MDNVCTTKKCGRNMSHEDGFSSQRGDCNQQGWRSNEYINGRFTTTVGASFKQTLKVGLSENKLCMPNIHWLILVAVLLQVKLPQILPQSRIESRPSGTHTHTHTSIVLYYTIPYFTLRYYTMQYFAISFFYYTHTSTHTNANSNMNANASTNANINAKINANTNAKTNTKQLKAD